MDRTISESDLYLARKQVIAMQNKIDMLEELLNECCAYLEDEADMVQKDGEDVPNRALSILSHIIDEGFYR